MFSELCFNVFDLCFVMVVVGLYRWGFGGLGGLVVCFGFADWLVVYAMCLCGVEIWVFGFACGWFWWFEWFGLDFCV